GGPGARRRRRRHRGARARRGRRAARLRAPAHGPRGAVSAETPAALRARLEAAVEARARLRARPLHETIAALAAAAARWRDDAALRAELPAAACLSSTMIAAVVPIAAAALGRAEVVVATGSDATLAALVPRLGRRLIAHGPRWSVAVVERAAAAEVDAIALDVALHDQRGCLSPHAVYVTGDARGFAER